MILAAENLAHYLARRGVVRRASIVAGDFTVLACSARNRNFKVFRRTGGGHFVKQAMSDEALATESVRRDASCHWLAAHDDDFAALRPWIPALRGFDRENGVLVTELLADHESLVRLRLRDTTFPPGLATLLGRALADVHGQVGRALRARGENPWFPARRPWILHASRAQEMGFRVDSGAHAELFRLLATHAVLAPSLARLEAAWQPDAFMHGDLKWDNCVVRAPAKGERDWSLRIVDWELSDFGMASWDVGSILQAFLSEWIFASPAGAPTIALHADARLLSQHPAMRGFWVAYADARGWGPEERSRQAVRVAEHAAARLVQTVYEFGSNLQAIAPAGQMLLRVAVHMFLDPVLAARELLGLAEAGAP